MCRTIPYLIVRVDDRLASLRESGPGINYPEVDRNRILAPGLNRSPMESIVHLCEAVAKPPVTKTCAKGVRHCAPHPPRQHRPRSV